MGILRVVISNLSYRKISSILTTVSVSIGVVLLIAILIISSALRQGALHQTGDYDMIVGAKGSASQLVLSSIFHYDVPIGNIDYEIFEKLARDERAEKVIPLALGDSYGSYRIIGTDYTYFADQIEEIDGILQEGTFYKEVGDVIIGWKIAEAGSLGMHATFQGAHGVDGVDLGDDGHDHDLEYRVVGIMKPQHSADDYVIFTMIESVWEEHHIHGTHTPFYHYRDDSFIGEDDHHHDDEDDHHHDDEDDHHHDDEDDHHHDDEDDHHHDDEDDHHHDDEDDHHHDDEDDHHHDDEDDHHHDDEDDHHHDDEDDHHHDDEDDHHHDDEDNHHHGHRHDEEKEITAILVKSQNIVASSTLRSEIEGDMQHPAQAAFIVVVLRQLLNLLGDGMAVANFLAYISITIAAISIFISLMSSMTERRKDVAIMRMLGSSKTKILTIVILEALFVTGLGIVIGVAGGHALAHWAGIQLQSTAGLYVNALQYWSGELAIAGIVLLFGLLAGIIPALSVYKTEPTHYMHE